MPFATALAALLLMACTVLVPTLAAAPAQAAATGQAATTVPTTTTDDDESVTLTVSPAASPVLQPGQDLQLTVAITNPTSAVLPVGTLDVYLAQRALTTRGALGKWLHPENPDNPGNPGDLMLSTPTAVEIPAGATVTQQVTVPAASVALGTGNAWGARGVAATLTTDTDVLAQGRGTFVWYLGEAVTPVDLGVIAPITVPVQATGLIPLADLESYTSPTGLLSRGLDSVVDRAVTIAIDPMIIASIRILGSSAPPDALAWLDRLDRAANDIFPLGYADADLSLQAQAGAATALAPVSLDQAIDPTLFTTPPATGGETAPVGTETPTPPAAGAPPTSAELLAWTYTARDIAWPQPNAVARADLDVFAASGLTTTILAGGNVSQSKTATPNAAVTLEAGSGLVSDDDLSAAIQDAATATTDDSWRAAVAEAGSVLAVVAAEQPGTARTLLATFDRGWGQSETRLGQTLDALGALPWQTPVGLAAVRDAAPASDVTFDAQAQPGNRVDLARQLLGREAEVTAFSTAVANPLALTGSLRLDLLALLATAWVDEADTWPSLVATNLAESRGILNSVSVTTRGPINVAADKVPFPITLRNELNQAVTVRVQVVPSNGRLLVGSDIESTIDANSTTRMTVPVTAAVGNGEVTLRVSMFTAGGVAVGVPALIAVNVHADWEGIGAWVLATAAILFFGFGIWRNIVRRRKERVAAIDTEAPTPATPDEDPHV